MLSFPLSPSWLLWLWRTASVFFSGRSQIICTAAETWKNKEMELETLTLVRAKSAEKENTPKQQYMNGRSKMETASEI
jgi:hypothetical protein